MLGLACGLWSGAGLADDVGDPLAALTPLGQGDLAALSGRQGISISDQELNAITHGGTFVAGGDIQTGQVDFGNSMHGMRGMANQAVNTGNNASVNAGMTVHIHLY
jgi:hypothetical protein